MLLPTYLSVGRMSAGQIESGALSTGWEVFPHCQDLPFHYALPERSRVGGVLASHPMEADSFTQQQCCMLEPSQGLREEVWATQVTVYAHVQCITHGIPRLGPQSTSAVPRPSSVLLLPPQLLTCFHGSYCQLQSITMSSQPAPRGPHCRRHVLLSLASPPRRRSGMALASAATVRWKMMMGGQEDDVEDENDDEKKHIPCWQFCRVC